MAHVLIMPRQGNTVESCIITDWKVREGDTVMAETTVCEVETDKAAFEVPAGKAGTVLKLLYASGDDVPVLQPIAIIGESGEDWQAILGNREQGTEDRAEVSGHSGSSTFAGGKQQPQSPIPDLQSLSVSAPLREENSEISISPRARNLAAKEGLPLSIPGTGPGGRIIERDVVAALQNRPWLTAAAKASGPENIPEAGSGPGGRVTVADLASAVDAASLAPGPQSPVPAYTETPIKGVRKIIADRMLKSLVESAQFTLNASASVAELQKIRSKLNAGADPAGENGPSKITVNDLILFAVSRTLKRFPFMNAHKIGDTIRTFERVHLGMAVDTPRGLLVPVIRNADLLSLAEISPEAKRLAAACQNGTAKHNELIGSTFTVTNLGSLGVTGFTPILNIPEIAILGVCGIEMKPVVQTKTDQTIIPNSSFLINFEPYIGFSLTINHQVVDGAPAAKFLNALCEAVAHIDDLLTAG